MIGLQTPRNPRAGVAGSATRPSGSGTDACLERLASYLAKLPFAVRIVLIRPKMGGNGKAIFCRLTGVCDRKCQGAIAGEVGTSDLV